MRLNRRFALLSGGGGGFAIPTFDGSHAVFGDEKQGYIELYTSGTLTFIKNSIVDIYIVGGGQNGGRATRTVSDNGETYFYSGKGGDGGKIYSVVGLEVNGEYNVQIASAGGDSVMGVMSSANGDIKASGGASFYTANAYGRQGNPGQDAPHPFNDSAFNQVGAGGGSGFVLRAKGKSFSGGSGGILGGGNGGGNNDVASDGKAATANTGSGGGGGAADQSTSRLCSGGAGGSGIVIVRWGYAA